MVHSISESFGNLSIPITKAQIVKVERLVIHWALRKTNSLTLDGPYLGVDPIAFTTSDYNALFDIFDVHQKDVELAIRDTPSINRSFKVTSDPFNLLSMWLVHIAPIYIKDKRICHTFQTHILTYLHYKFFTGVVNNSFRHGTNRGILESTIAGLSKKSDVIRLGSWRRVIDSHVEKILNPQERFYQYISDASPDEMFLQVLAEAQTGIRAKIITFASSYYETYASGDSMGFTSAVSENADGEKIIAQTASVVDSASALMVSEILNPNLFIHEISVDDVARLFSTISPRMLKTALLQVNEIAILQAASRSFDKITIDKEGTQYIGIRVLIIEVIRSMIRICRMRKINLGNRAKVFETIRNIYSSSRSLDKDIIDIKRSVGNMVDSFNITSNQASQAALRLAVIYYIVYRTVQKMKV